jgi:hypothetical protein
VCKWDARCLLSETQRNERKVDSIAYLVRRDDLLKFTVLIAATSQPRACKTVVAMVLPT